MGERMKRKTVPDDTVCLLCDAIINRNDDLIEEILTSLGMTPGSSRAKKFLHRVARRCSEKLGEA